MRFCFPPFENIPSSSVYAQCDFVVHEWQKERACSLFFSPPPKIDIFFLYLCNVTVLCASVAYGAHVLLLL